MMVVVQRRSDGLYYVNGTGRHNRWHREWTNDISEVKPFRGLRGVRSAFSPGSFYWGSGWPGRQSTYVDKCCEEMKWSLSRGWKNQCEHFKAARVKKIAEFKAKYAIIEVQIRPVREIEYA